MNWLNWNPETQEITEENGIADVVVGYASSGADAIAFALEAGMRISIPAYSEAS